MITYFYYNNCNYLCYNEFMKNKKDFIDLVQKKISELTNVPELLIVSKNEALANAFGMRVDQETTAATLMLENESFAETSTHSQFVNAVSRSYDMHKGEIKVYRGKHFGELRFKAPANMTYDQYIEKVGKLPRQKYFATQLRVRPKDIIHETYAEEASDKTKLIQNILVQEINENTVQSIELKDNGAYHIVLKPKHSHPYFCMQVRFNGGFDEFPEVSEGSVDIFLDKSGKISQVKSYDVYKAKIGIITVTIHSVTTSNYIIGKNGMFLVNGVEQELHAPEINDAFQVYPLVTDTLPSKRRKK